MLKPKLINTHSEKDSLIFILKDKNYSNLILFILIIPFVTTLISVAIEYKYLKTFYTFLLFFPFIFLTLFVSNQILLSRKEFIKELLFEHLQTKINQDNNFIIDYKYDNNIFSFLLSNSSEIKFKTEIIKNFENSFLIKCYLKPI